MGTYSEIRYSCSSEIPGTRQKLSSESLVQQMQSFIYEYDVTQSTPRSLKHFNCVSLNEHDGQIDTDSNTALTAPAQTQVTLPVSDASCQYDQKYKRQNLENSSEIDCDLYSGRYGPDGIAPSSRWFHRRSCVPRLGHTNPPASWKDFDTGSCTQYLENAENYEIPSPRNSVFQEPKAAPIKLSNVAEEGVKRLEQLNKKVLLAMETQPLDRRRSSVETSGSCQRRDSEQIRFIVGYEQPARSALASEYIPPDPGKRPYQPLTRPEGQIRLFRLNQAAHGGQISGSFVYSDIKSCPKYTALSYAWGEPTKTRKITIERECDLEIGENLWWFLHCRSLSLKKPRLFWIDAVCIDQSNVNERNHQVSLMKQIYSMASNVYIWLGRESENSRLAMDFLANEGANPSKRQSDNGHPIWDRQEGKAVRDLCKRPYWRRMWIIQEIIHANRLTVWCGSQRIDWPVFDRLYLAMKTIEENDRFKNHDFVKEVLQSPAFVMVWQRAHWRHPETPTPKLQTLIETFKGWECTDLRDKVYALVSMADQETAVLPNYSRSPRQIYYDVLRRGVAYDDRFCNLLSHILGIHEAGIGFAGLYVTRVPSSRSQARRASD